MPRARALLSAAVHLSPRPAAGDTNLRREVETMLAAHDAAGQFGETPLFTSVPPLAQSSSVLVGQPQAVPSEEMALAPGARLGPYEIVAALGAGGMGEVYRAHDTRLSRDVAIKTLPPTIGDNTERIARFSREARVLASLNHPKIAAIYGLEKSGHLNHLVMELVEGEILSGPVPVEQGARLCAAGRRGAGSRSRQGHHPPRYQASQRQGHARRQGEGAGFRVGESCRGDRRDRESFPVEH